MKKLLTFFILVGIVLSAFFAVTSAISNIVLMFNAFPESADDKYAYMFILGRWTFTAVMGLIFWLLYRLPKR